MNEDQVYYFIHYIELDSPPTEDAIALNHTGYLYIGSAEFSPHNLASVASQDNTYFTLQDARVALRKIGSALTTSSGMLSL